MQRAKKSIRLEKGLRIFPTTHRDGTGETQTADRWYIEFRDHDRVIRRLPAFPDRPQSEELARKVKKLVAWKVTGELPDAGLSRWIETMPDKLRNTLAVGRFWTPAALPPASRWPSIWTIGKPRWRPRALPPVMASW